MPHNKAPETSQNEITLLANVIPWYRIECQPLPWQKAGQQQTASGYGAKLTSTHIVRLPSGKTRRIYITQYGNAGSAWIVLSGQKLFLLDSDFDGEMNR